MLPAQIFTWLALYLHAKSKKGLTLPLLPDFKLILSPFHLQSEVYFPPFALIY